jgi:Peptidase family M28
MTRVGPVRKCLYFLGAIAAGAAVSAVSAQNSSGGEAPDPRISATLNDISAPHVQASIEKLVSFGTRLTISAQDEPAIRAGHGVGAARDWIRSEFERYSKDCGGCLEVREDSFLAPASERIPHPTKITNVYAILRGISPESASRIVLVTGHYDSRNSDTSDTTGDAPGANDDASGTAVSLECARVLSKLKFPASIMFLAVAGEEQGLDGSAHFAQMAREQGWKIEAALNNDIVGGDKGNGQDASTVRVFSEGLPVLATAAQIHRLRGIGGESDSASRELARYIFAVGRIYDAGIRPALIYRPDRYLRGGDHLSFNEAGYAAVRFTEWRENFHHQHQNVRVESGIQYGDLLKFVDFKYVSHVARLNAAVLAELASSPAAPSNVELATRQLENDSTLNWTRSADAASYEVLWRSTTSPDWEHVQRFGDVTSATLPISKDNVIFAVRAVDAAGHRGLAVVPVPQR